MKVKTLTRMICGATIGSLAVITGTYFLSRESSLQPRPYSSSFSDNRTDYDPTRPIEYKDGSVFLPVKKKEKPATFFPYGDMKGKERD